MAQEVVLEVRDLKTYFLGDRSVNRAVDGISYQLHKGECMAIIGESGSGKSVSALSLLKLISFPPGVIVNGEVLLDGENILKYTDEQIRQLRGGQIGMIFQEPTAALHPVMTIGAQIAENIMTHINVGKREAWQQAVELLRKVGIPEAAERAKDYPYQFSGGMQQRAMIAMAMSCRPRVLIADEPTTALDVTVQAQVLNTLDQLRHELDTALILITHNLGVVARYADTAKIMYGGRIVEEGTTDDIFYSPKHPYTVGLLMAVPRLRRKKAGKLTAIEGEPPNMSQIPPDCCAFRCRCQYADELCGRQRPELEQVQGTHYCACFHMDKVHAQMREEAQ